MNLSYTSNTAQQIQHCEQLVQQLIQQTQQASQLYQQMLQQEQQNAQMLEQLAQRERQAVHHIQTALQGHQTAIQQMQHVSNICRQLEGTLRHTADTTGTSYMTGDMPAYTNRQQHQSF